MSDEGHRAAPRVPGRTGSAIRAGAAAGGKRLPSVVKTLLCFVLVGPPLGTLIFAATFALLAAGSLGQVSDAGSLFMFLALYGVPVGYWIGLPSAAVAGAAIGLWQAYRGRLGLAGATAIGACVGAGTVLIAKAQAQPIAALPLLVASIASTLVCWRLIRVDPHE